MPDSIAQIGSFHLVEPIAKGGMGVIFRAVHDTTGMPAAIKVIQNGADGDVRRGLHREVQAHAGLVHPRVVYLFDHGVVGDEAADASGDIVEAGGPYVAMELADRGTVRDQLPIRRWSTLRKLLLQILDGLAFAHARNVIHRDLKPENLLLFSNDGADPVLKLADFGIAHAFGNEHLRDRDSLQAITGTPYYMAPEQFRGRWRAFGPWTDLYSVGCIAWELACQGKPFAERSLVALALRHCEDERPSLEPAFDVPDELEAWIHRAMSIQPEHRFRRAADAANALPPLSLSLISTAPRRGQEVPLEDEDPLTLQETLALTLAPTSDWPLAATVDADSTEEMATIGDAHAIGSADADGIRRGDRRRTSEVPKARLPDWRAHQRDPLPMSQIGTGLGLFGLRRVPFVDRDQERDLLWQALREVVEDDQLRIVMISGESGVGKSRLADWLLTRAHEMGGRTRTFRAVHTPGGQGAAEGFQGMIQRALRTWKLGRGEFYDHVRNLVSETDARGLTELVHPTENMAEVVDGPRFQFVGAAERHALKTRVFAELLGEHLPLIWLDDLQWGSEALGLVQYLLQNLDISPPALLVGTLRSDIVAEDKALQRRIDAICRHDHCQRIDLSPLGDSEFQELLHCMLPLETTLAQLVTERTEGTPLFAHQLLNAWIADERLIETANGFAFDGDAAASVPDDIHSLWMDRLHQLVTSYPSADHGQSWEAIELAAAVGREINHEEWLAICDDADLSPPPNLADNLIDRGLAERTDGGWRFAHSLLVDSLQRRASEAGRWRVHHRRCARFLESQTDDRRHRTALRRAEHWIDAEELESALAPLLYESKRLHRLGEPDRAQRLLRRRKTLLDRLQRGVDHRDQLENELQVLNTRRVTGDTGDALQALETLIERAQRTDHFECAIRACIALSDCLRRLGKLQAGRTALEPALTLAEHVDDRRDQRLLRGQIHRSLGWVAYDAGNLDSAQQHFERARTLLQESGTSYDALWLDGPLGWIDIIRGRHKRAKSRFETMLENARERGFRPFESYALIALGDMARFHGDLFTAERMYRHSRALESQMGFVNGEINVLLNLAQTALKAGDFSTTQDLLQQAQALETPDSQSEFQLRFDCIYCALWCGLGKWSRFDECFKPYTDGSWSDDWRLLKDHPWVLEIAGELAAQSNKTERATRLWELTRKLWERLGDTEAVERLDRRLDDMLQRRR